jgi:hypothetical protein
MSYLVKIFPRVVRPNIEQFSISPLSIATSKLPSLLSPYTTSRPAFYQKRTQASSSASANCLPATASSRKRIIVAMTGATGVVLGVEILKSLRKLGVETHLIMSKWAGAGMKTKQTTPQSTSVALPVSATPSKNNQQPYPAVHFTVMGYRCALQYEDFG